LRHFTFMGWRLQQSNERGKRGRGGGKKRSKKGTSYEELEEQATAVTSGSTTLGVTKKTEVGRMEKAKGPSKKKGRGTQLFQGTLWLETNGTSGGGRGGYDSEGTFQGKKKTWKAKSAALLAKNPGTDEKKVSHGGCKG